jgi:hypothetical protein
MNQHRHILSLCFDYGSDCFCIVVDVTGAVALQGKYEPFDIQLCGGAFFRLLVGIFRLIVGKVHNDTDIMFDESFLNEGSGDTAGAINQALAYNAESFGNNAVLDYFLPQPDSASDQQNAKEHGIYSAACGFGFYVAL